MTKPLKFIIEALLFVTEEPLSIRQIKQFLETEESAAIGAAMDELIEEYAQRGGGFELRQVAGGFQFRTRSEYSEWVKKLLKPSPARLSRAALETLAIIAYKQPITKADVEHIRGVDCGGVLRMLLEKKLIRVLGRRDIPGRPMIYGTTRQFLEVFNLKDLRDLPSPKEIAALGTETEDDLSLSAALPENQLPSGHDAPLPANESPGDVESLNSAPSSTKEGQEDGTPREAAAEAPEDHQRHRASTERNGSAMDRPPGNGLPQDMPEAANRSPAEDSRVSPDHRNSTGIAQEKQSDRNKS
jgi:segregation and condensation protein B